VRVERNQSNLNLQKQMQKLEEAVVGKIKIFSLVPRRRQVTLGGQRAVLFEPMVSRRLTGPMKGFILRGILTSMHQNGDGARAVHITSEALGGDVGGRLQKFLSGEIAKHLLGRESAETVGAISQKFDNRCIFRVSLDAGVDVADFSDSQGEPKGMLVDELAHGQDVVCILAPRAVVIRLDDKFAIDSWYIEWSTSVLQVHSKSDEMIGQSVVDAVAMPEVPTFKKDPEESRDFENHSQISTYSMDYVSDGLPRPYTPVAPAYPPPPLASVPNVAAFSLPFEDDVLEEQSLTMLEYEAERISNV
jgi:hypothetical protein